MPVQSIVSEAQRALSKILPPSWNEPKQIINVESARKAVKTYTVEDISLLLPSKLKCKESENTANPAPLPKATATKGKVKVVENQPQPITFLRGSNFDEVYTFGRVSCEVEDSPTISLQDLFNDGFECSTPTLCNNMNLEDLLNTPQSFHFEDLLNKSFLSTPSDCVSSK